MNSSPAELKALLGELSTLTTDDYEQGFPLKETDVDALSFALDQALQDDKSPDLADRAEQIALAADWLKEKGRLSAETRIDLFGEPPVTNIPSRGFENPLKVYTLSEAQKVGVVTMVTRSFELHFDAIMLVSIQGIYVSLPLKEGKVVRPAMSILDPAQVGALLPYFTRNTKISSSTSEWKRFGTMLNRAEINSVPTHPLHSRVKTETCFTLDKEPTTDGVFGIQIHVLGDPALLTSLGYQGQEGEIVASQDARLLPFPAYEKTFFSLPTSYPRGTYILPGGEKRGEIEFEGPDGQPYTLSFYNYSGIALMISKTKGKNERVRYVRPENRERFWHLVDRWIETLRNGDKEVDLDKAAPDEDFFSFFYDDPTSIHNNAIYGLEGIIWNDVKHVIQNKEHCLVIRQEGPLLEALGYDPSQTTTLSSPPVVEGFLNREGFRKAFSPSTPTRPSVSPSLYSGRRSGVLPSSILDVAFPLTDHPTPREIIPERQVIVVNPEEITVLEFPEGPGIEPEKYGIYSFNGVLVIIRLDAGEKPPIWFVPITEGKGLFALIPYWKQNLAALRPSFQKLLDRYQALTPSVKPVVSFGSGLPGSVEWKGRFSLRFQSLALARAWGYDRPGKTSYTILSATQSSSTLVFYGEKKQIVAAYRLYYFGDLVLVKGVFGEELSLRVFKNRADAAPFIRFFEETVDPTLMDSPTIQEEFARLFSEERVSETLHLDPLPTEDGTRRRFGFHLGGKEFQIYVREQDNVPQIFMPDGTSARFIGYPDFFDYPLVVPSRLFKLIKITANMLPPNMLKHFEPADEITLMWIDFQGVPVLFGSSDNRNPFFILFSKPVGGELQQMFALTEMTAGAVQKARALLKSLLARGEPPHFLVNQETGLNTTTDNGNVSFHFRPKWEGEPTDFMIRRFEMLIKEISPWLKEMGFRERGEDKQVRFKSVFSRTVHDIEVYQFGPFTAIHKPPLRQIELYEPLFEGEKLSETKPFLILERKGDRFITPSDPRVELSVTSVPLPGKPRLEEACLSFPLTEEWQKWGRGTMEISHPLIPVDPSEPKIDIPGNHTLFYSGPFVASHVQGKDLEMLYLMAQGMANENAITLFRDSTAPHLFVPFSQLHPMDQTGIIQSLKKGGDTKVVLRFEKMQATPDPGVRVITNGYDLEGAFVTYTRNAVLDSVMTSREEKPTEEKLDLSFVPSSGEHLIPLRQAVEQITREDLSVSLETGNISYPPLWWHPLSTTDGDSPYSLSLPVTRLGELKTGHALTLNTGGGTVDYMLQQKKGGGFDLLDYGVKVGTLDIVRGELNLKIGKSFSITGPLPIRESASSVTIRGTGRREKWNFLMESASTSTPLFPGGFFGEEGWIMTLQKPASLSQEDFEAHLPEALTAIKEASDFWETNHPSGEPVISVPEQEDDNWSFHTEVSSPLNYTAAKFALSGLLQSRGDSTRLHDLTLDWEGASIPLNVSSVPPWVWTDGDGKQVFKGIQAPYATDDVSVTRDFSVAFKKQKIDWVSFVEHRIYHLNNDEKIQIDLQPQGNSFQVLSASLHRTNQNYPLTIRPLSNGLVALICHNGLKIPHEADEYHVRLSPRPTSQDISSNLISSVIVPFSQGAGHFRFVISQEGDRLRILSAENHLKGGPVKIREVPDLVRPGGTFKIPLHWNFEPYGEVEGVVSFTVTGHQDWPVSTDLEIFESMNGFSWIGRRTTNGYQIQHLSRNGQGDLSVTLPWGKRVGVHLQTTGGSCELRIKAPANAHSSEPLFIEPLSPVAVEGARLLDSRETVGVVPAYLIDRTVETEGLPLAAVSHPRLDVAQALGDLSPEGAFFPTRESLSRMVKVAGSLSTGQSDPVRLTFISRDGTLFLEDDFVYDPQHPDLWRPFHETEAENHQRTLTINGSLMTSIARRRGEARWEFIPIPPGTTRLHTAQIPGKLGALVLFNASGASDFQYVSRRQDALAGFHDYLSIQQAGLFDGVTKRYFNNPRWEGTVSQLTENKLRLSLEEESAESTNQTLFLEFGYHQDTGALFFENGRTEITLKDGKEVRFEGLFEAHQKSDGTFVLVQINAPEGMEPAVFRGMILAGGRPIIVPSALSPQEVSDENIPNLYDQGWLDRYQPHAIRNGSGPHNGDGGDHPKKVSDGGLKTVRYLFPEEIPQAGRDILPHQVDEQSLEELTTYGTKENPVSPKQVVLLDIWLSNGGSDFQLLPESIVRYQRACENLRHQTFGKDKKEIKALLKKIEPLYLLLKNGTGTLMEIRLVPCLSPVKDAEPRYVFDENGTRNKGVTFRLTGENPATGGSVQIVVPVTYDRSGLDETLKLFDPLGDRGVMRVFKTVFSKSGDLFAVYDATDRKKPETEVEIRAGLWTSTIRRKFLAEKRLRTLQGLIAEQEEIFRFEGNEPDLVEEDNDIMNCWLMAETDAEGGGTGRWLRVTLPIPHEGIQELRGRVVSFPLKTKIKLEVRHELIDGDSWKEATFDVFRTPDNSLILHGDSDQRYLLWFDPQKGDSPLVRRLHDFETGTDLHAFYHPPQWSFVYEVDRVRTEKETSGLGRVEEVTGEYRAQGLATEGEKGLRYHLYVDELGAETLMDIRTDFSGDIVEVFADSWSLGDFIMKPEHTAVAVMTPEDLAHYKEPELYYGASSFRNGATRRLLLRHRPVSADEAVGNSRWLAVDVKPNAEGRFDREGTTIERVKFIRLPQNPLQFYFPRETASPFTYTRQKKEGSVVHPHGFVLTQQSASNATEYTLRFYDDESADERRDLVFVLEKNDAGLFELQKGSVNLLNINSGRYLLEGEDADLTPTVEGALIRCELNHKRFDAVFYINAEGQPIAAHPFFYTERSGSRKEEEQAKAERTGRRLGLQAEWYAQNRIAFEKLRRSLEKPNSLDEADPLALFSTHPLARTPLGVLMMESLNHYRGEALRYLRLDAEDDLALFAVKLVECALNWFERGDYSRLQLLADMLVLSLKIPSSMWEDFVHEVINDVIDPDYYEKIETLKAYQGLLLQVVEEVESRQNLAKKLRVIRKEQRTQADDQAIFQSLKATVTDKGETVAHYMKEHQISRWMHDKGAPKIDWKEQVEAEVRAEEEAAQRRIEELRSDISRLTGQIETVLASHLVYIGMVKQMGELYTAPELNSSSLLIKDRLEIWQAVLETILALAQGEEYKKLALLGDILASLMEVKENRQSWAFDHYFPALAGELSRGKSNKLKAFHGVALILDLMVIPYLDEMLTAIKKWPRSGPEAKMVADIQVSEPSPRSIPRTYMAKQGVPSWFPGIFTWENLVLGQQGEIVDGLEEEPDSSAFRDAEDAERAEPETPPAGPFGSPLNPMGITSAKPRSATPLKGLFKI